MDLSTTDCPYDGTALTVNIDAAGTVVLVCSECHAAWEPDGSFVSQLRTEIMQPTR
jgi:hypothetical protein